MSTKPTLWLPSLADIFFLCPFLYLSFVRGNTLLNDADTGYHIRAGEYIINNLKVPRYDIFSHISPPLPWFAHEWLSEVVMALVHRFSGLTGVVIFFSFLLGVTYCLLFKFSRSLNCNLVVTVLVVLLATVSSSLHWLARPHIFSLVLIVVWYRILDDYQQNGKDRLYVLVPLMLLWANLHGGFILGFILLGVYLTGNMMFVVFSKESKRNTPIEKCKKLAAVIGLCLLFSLLNPRGYFLWLFPFGTVSNQWLMDNVLEFLSPNFHQPLPYKYLLLLAIGVFALSRRGVTAIELMLVLLFTYMSLYSARYIPLFAIIVTPILLRHVEGILQKADNCALKFFQERAKNLALIEDAGTRRHFWPTISIVSVCVLVLGGKIEFEFDQVKKPVAAVEFLKKEKMPGKMFNDDEFGDYLIYATWPEYKVFFDGRSDMYGEKWGGEYLKIVSIQPGWEQTVDENNFGWIFIGAKTPLSTILLEKKNWQLVYADKLAHILAKRTPENRAVLDKYPDVKPVSVIPGTQY
jgi:hypothetical protein